MNPTSANEARRSRVLPPLPTEVASQPSESPNLEPAYDVDPGFGPPMRLPSYRWRNNSGPPLSPPPDLPPCLPLVSLSPPSYTPPTPPISNTLPPPSPPPSYPPPPSPDTPPTSPPPYPPPPCSPLVPLFPPSYDPPTPDDSLPLVPLSPPSYAPPPLLLPATEQTTVSMTEVATTLSIPYGSCPPIPSTLPPAFEAVPESPLVVVHHSVMSPSVPKAIPSEFEVLHELYHVHYLTVLQSIQRSDDNLTRGNQTTLPPDLWLNILKRLLPQATFRLSVTCKFFYNLADNDSIWKQFYIMYHPSVPNPTLEKGERSWKLKFKYESGIISKAGMVERRTGVLWSVWGPVWLVLCGVNAYIFANIENIQQKESYLKQLSREGMQSLLDQFQVTQVINLKSASLLQSTAAKNGKLRFGLKTSTTEVYFNATFDVAKGWVKVLRARIENLVNDFTVKPYSPSNL